MAQSRNPRLPKEEARRADKEEFSKRISDKRRSRADTQKGKVGAAISPAKLKEVGKAVAKVLLPLPSLAAPHIVKGVLEAPLRSRELKKTLSKRNKNSNGLTR